jgi:hypothetical protein
MTQEISSAAQARLRLRLVVAAIFSAGISVSASAETPRPGFYPGAADPYRNPAKYEAFLARNHELIGRFATIVAEMREHPDQRGCIGRPLFTCVATLSQYLPIGTEFFAGAEFERMNWPFDEQTDINGAPVMPPQLQLKVLLPEYHGGGVVFVEFSKATRIVTSIRLPLAGDALNAQTFADYEATKIYDVAAAALPTDCIQADRQAFYRLINSEAKLNQRGEHTDDLSPVEISTSSAVIGRVTLCGMKLEIENYGLSSTEEVSLENPHGVFAGHALTISSAPPAPNSSKPRPKRAR